MGVPPEYARDAVAGLLSHLQDLPEAQALSSALSGTDKEHTAQAASMLHRRLIRESCPDVWLTPGGVLAEEWNVVVDLAADRGRQAHMISEWLSGYSEPSSTPVDGLASEG